MKSLARAVLALVLALFGRVAHAQQYDGCGTLFQHPGCLTLRDDSGRTWFLGQAGPQEHGTRARVRGNYVEFCFCPWAQGCLGEVIVTPCEPACRADFDGSGSLTVQDLFEFLAAYFVGLTGPSPPGGDFDQSGEVSVQDIFAFLAAWFSACAT